jgi:hypothetical protein
MTWLYASKPQAEIDNTQLKWANIQWEWANIQWEWADTNTDLKRADVDTQQELADALKLTWEEPEPQPAPGGPGGPPDEPKPGPAPGGPGGPGENPPDKPGPTEPQQSDLDHNWEPIQPNVNTSEIQILSAVVKLPPNTEPSDFLPRDTQHAKRYFEALETEAKASGNQSFFSRLRNKISALKDSIGFGHKAKVTELLGILIQWYADMSSENSNLSQVKQKFVTVLWDANPHKIYKAMSKFVVDTQILKTFLQIS